MQDLFDLTPELMLEQSQQMLNLRADYENLLSNIASDLNNMNTCWSDILSNNFSGKIGSAQKAFSGALVMLQNSANSVKMVAETAQEMDKSWASKIGGSADQSLVGLYKNPVMTQLALNLINWDPKAEVKNALELLDKWKETVDDTVPPSVRAWIKYIAEKADEAFLDDKLGDMDDAVSLTKKLLEGDIAGFGKDVLLWETKEIFKEAVTGTLGSPVNIAGFEYDPTMKYYLNLGLGIGESVGEFVLEPSWENLTEIAWSATVQPMLDTAGDTIETVTRLIPGISEYYYDEHGAEDIGDAAAVALGDFYGLFSPDEGIKEYAANYYKDGIWEGLWGGFEDIGSFIKDSGGVGEAAKSFFSTAWSDTKDNFGYVAENAGIVWDSLSKLVTQADGTPLGKMSFGGNSANGGGAW
jgi:uncharacterized protein YukE